MVFLVFGQTYRFDFINYDDDYHVYANASVTNGLTFSGLAWAFRHSHEDYWHPLDFVSHMVDCQLFGLNPAGHHLVNVSLHALVAVLLFLVLRRMTGALWPSAFASVIFAIHPLRVESVAWISERKDLLHGLFFVLTLAAYMRYVRRPGSLGRYLVVVFCFVLGLMSKPTLMPLPFLLLLLDYWPLGRFGGNESHLTVLSRLVAEKVPLLVLSLLSCLEAAAGNSSAFISSRQVSLGFQLANSLTSYVAYLRQSVWPANLALLYPFPASGVPVEELCFSVVFLALTSAGAFLARKRHPHLFIGWFWFLGMLVPMIGIIQAGAYARADRYTYLPHIGLCILVAWTAKSLMPARRASRRILAVGMASLVGLLVLSAWKQTGYWRNSETLWRHTLACTSGNPIAHISLGAALVAENRYPEAVEQFQAALAINPDSAEAYYNFAATLAAQNRRAEAIECYRRALERRPDYAKALNNLGILLAAAGRADEAVQCFRSALASKPGYAEAGNNLGIMLAGQSRLPEAIVLFRKAVAAEPAYVDARLNLGNALLLTGLTNEATQQYANALRLNPSCEAAREQLRSLGQRQAPKLP
jgi:tetratricopeptide (TPR) repeat protein